MAKIHHATLARIVSLGLEADYDQTTEIATFQYDDQTYRVPFAEVKEFAASIAVLEGDEGKEPEQDITQWLVDDEDTTEGDDDAEEGSPEGEEEGEPEEGEPEEGGSVVKEAYKAKYRAFGGSCGDAMADAMKVATTTSFTLPSGKVKTSVSLSALMVVAETNSVDMSPYAGRNNGLQRMTLGNILRAKIKHGIDVQVGTQVFPGDEQVEKPAKVRPAKEPKTPADVAAAARPVPFSYLPSGEKDIKAAIFQMVQDSATAGHPTPDFETLISDSGCTLKEIRPMSKMVATDHLTAIVVSDRAQFAKEFKRTA